MRKALMGALGLAALASMQPALAQSNCKSICHTYYGTAGPVRTCQQGCTPRVSGRPDKPQPIQQQRFKNKF
jgi:hypothetical protein